MKTGTTLQVKKNNKLLIQHGFGFAAAYKLQLQVTIEYFICYREKIHWYAAAMFPIFQTIIKLLFMMNIMKIQFCTILQLK